MATSGRSRPRRPRPAAAELSSAGRPGPRRGAHDDRHHPLRHAGARRLLRRPDPQPRGARPGADRRLVDAPGLRAHRRDLHHPPRDLAPPLPPRRGPPLARRLPHRLRADDHGQHQRPVGALLLPLHRRGPVLRRRRPGGVRQGAVRRLRRRRRRRTLRLPRLGRLRQLHQGPQVLPALLLGHAHRLLAAPGRVLAGLHQLHRRLQDQVRQVGDLPPLQLDHHAQPGVLGGHRERLPRFPFLPLHLPLRRRLQRRQLAALPAAPEAGPAERTRRSRRRRRPGPLPRIPQRPRGHLSTRPRLAAHADDLAGRRPVLLDRRRQERPRVDERRRLLLRAQPRPLLPLRAAAAVGDLRHQPVSPQHLGGPLVGGLLPAGRPRPRQPLHATRARAPAAARPAVDRARLLAAAWPHLLRDRPGRAAGPHPARDTPGPVEPRRLAALLPVDLARRDARDRRLHRPRPSPPAQPHDPRPPLPARPRLGVQLAARPPRVALPRRHLPRPPHHHDEHRLVHAGHALHLLRVPQRQRARQPAAAAHRPRQAGDPQRGPEPPASPP